MKKSALLVAIFTLLTFFTACGRRQDILNQIESEKIAESMADAQERETNVIGITPRPQETVTPPPTDTVAPNQPTDTTPPPAPIDPSTLPNHEGYRLTAGLHLGDRGYYDGVTVEELKERFEAEGMLDMAGQMYNTPTGMIFNLEDTQMPAYFHKLTGNLSTLCPDPLCRHEDCVWVQLREILYISDEHIYFRSGDIVQAQVFRSDLERNHVEALDLVLGLGSRICFVENDKIYLQQNVYQ